MSSRFNEINWVINCAIAVITMMFGLALIFSLSYHNRDLREQEEVYTTEIKR